MDKQTHKNIYFFETIKKLQWIHKNFEYVQKKRMKNFEIDSDHSSKLAWLHELSRERVYLSWAIISLIWGERRGRRSPASSSRSIINASSHHLVGNFYHTKLFSAPLQRWKLSGLENHMEAKVHMHLHTNEITISNRPWEFFFQLFSLPREERDDSKISSLTLIVSWSWIPLLIWITQIHN